MLINPAPKVIKESDYFGHPLSFRVRQIPLCKRELGEASVSDAQHLSIVSRLRSPSNE
jgi:hypothetical protein